MALSKDEVRLRGNIWRGTAKITRKSYVCGYCGDRVASDSGYFSERKTYAADAFIYICPGCDGPTLFTLRNIQFPLPIPGQHVPNVPDELGILYREAREAAGAGAQTAAVLVCRKMLMHIAVAEGAEPNKSFAYYVEYLSEKGFLPPNGKGWVDHIRQRGNDANHEIVLMDAKDAEMLIGFVEMLLRFIYDFPNRVPDANPEAGSSQ